MFKLTIRRCLFPEIVSSWNFFPCLLPCLSVHLVMDESLADSESLVDEQVHASAG